MTDREKRNAAVDKFADAIKARLDEQAARGYAGWDGNTVRSSHYIADQLFADARNCVVTKKYGKAVDIAARAMMLWFREGGEG